MKSTFTKIMILAAVLALGLGANAQQYALYYNDTTAAALANGDTVHYTVSELELEGMGEAVVKFYVANLTDQDLSTDQAVSKISGSPAITLGEICAGGHCPATGPYTVPANTIDSRDISIHFSLGGASNTEALFKLTVGNSGSRLNNSIDAYIHLIVGGSNEGIDEAEAERPAVYPNPTTGRVNVGETEYDLSGQPAGVYVLPYGNRSVKVIKL